MAQLIKALSALLVLAGCTTPQQQAARMQVEMDRMMQVYGPACSKLGYPASSDQWRGCVLQLSTKEEMERYGYPNYYAGYAGRYWGLGARWIPY